MNKKITLYELLGLVKDGNAPKKIKFKDNIYDYKEIENGTGYVRPLNLNGLEWLANRVDIDDSEALNSEVEILDDEDKNNFTGWKMYQNGKEVASMDCSYDEDMEIEELHIINGAVDGKWENGSSYNYTLSAPQTVIIKKVNELVREINKLKKDK